MGGDDVEMDNGGENKKTRKVAHDIKNQLSNILLAISQLEYEMETINDDQRYYIDTITASSKQISTLLNDL